MEKLLLTKAEVAEILGVHPRTVDSLARSGKLPISINVGRQLRWRKKDIEVWLDDAFNSQLNEED